MLISSKYPGNADYLRLLRLQALRRHWSNSHKLKSLSVNKKLVAEDLL